MKHTKPTELATTNVKSPVAKNSKMAGKAGIHKNPKTAVAQPRKAKHKKAEMMETVVSVIGEDGNAPGYVKYEQMKDKISSVLIKLYNQGKDEETIQKMGTRVAQHLGYDPKDSIFQDAWMDSLMNASLDGSLDQDSEDDYTDYSMRQGELGNPDRFSEQGVAEGLEDTQKKIEDTINKLEDRLKHAKTDEQWDRISARIERLQAGLKRSKQGVAEGAPIVVMPSHKRLEKKHKPSLSRGMDPAKAQGEQDARDGKPYNNPYPFKKELGAPGNWEHNSYKASYDSVKQGVAEGFPDDILAMAKKVSPNARIRGSRDEEIARRDAMLAQRARDHANAPEPKGVSDDERASLEAELQQLMPKYDKDYQMIDKYTQYMQAKHIADRVHEIQRKLKSGVAEGILAEDIMGLGDNEFEPKQHHDPEGNMARNELYRNAKYALDLLKMIEPDDEIEPWVAANLTNAATWLDKVYHYLDYRTKFEPEMDMKKDDKGIKESEAEPSGDIARMNLQEIMEYSIKLFKMIKPETRLDGWVAMKLTKASECVSSSKHYLEHQYFEKHSSDMYESKILKKFAKTLSKK